MCAIAGRILVPLAFVVFWLNNFQLSTSVHVDKTDPNMCYNSSGIIIGMCYSSKQECINQHGVPVDGYCYLLFYQCCVKINRNYQYDVITDQDDRRISRAIYPKSFDAPEICSMTIEKHPLYYRQISTHFIDFTMPTSYDGETAVRDTDMAVTGGMSSGLKVCGHYIQQHFYYKLDGASDVITTVKITRSGIDYGDRSRGIRKITESSSVQTPVGCTQRFPDTTEDIRMTDIRVTHLIV